MDYRIRIRNMVKTVGPDTADRRGGRRPEEGLVAIETHVGLACAEGAS
jgi:hypothetical protein